ncbi:hypothetical protein V8G54_019683 [Vigna mungo]|uniref:Uncharacterized protein n=1 Tax=Vigna mungo TaxID=3915 RepID=A0AAQ3NC34_VIGMU
MNGGPSGFTNAPVTRLFIVASAIFTIFFGIQGRFGTLGLSYQGTVPVSNSGGRINASCSTFAFSRYFWKNSPLEVDHVHIFLLINARVDVWTVFIVFSILTSLLLEVLAVALLKGIILDIDPTANLVTPGPYGLIFASFVPFFFDIPLLLLKQVIHISSWCSGIVELNSGSILPGMCGILAGSLYRLNVFYIRKAKPDFLVYLATVINSTLLQQCMVEWLLVATFSIVACFPFAGDMVIFTTQNMAFCSAIVLLRKTNL